MLDFKNQTTKKHHSNKHESTFCFETFPHKQENNRNIDLLVSFLLFFVILGRFISCHRLICYKRLIQRAASSNTMSLANFISESCLDLTQPTSTSSEAALASFQMISAQNLTPSLSLKMEEETPTQEGNNKNHSKLDNKTQSLARGSKKSKIQKDGKSKSAINKKAIKTERKHIEYEVLQSSTVDSTHFTMVDEHIRADARMIEEYLESVADFPFYNKDQFLNELEESNPRNMLSDAPSTEQPYHIEIIYKTITFKSDMSRVHYWTTNKVEQQPANRRKTRNQGKRCISKDAFITYSDKNLAEMCYEAAKYRYYSPTSNPIADLALQLTSQYHTIEKSAAIHNLGSKADFTDAPTIAFGSPQHRSYAASLRERLERRKYIAVLDD